MSENKPKEAKMSAKSSGPSLFSAPRAAAPTYQPPISSPEWSGEDVPQKTEDKKNMTSQKDAKGRLVRSTGPHDVYGGPMKGKK